MIGFFIAILSGALMSIQGVFNTQATKQSGLWITSSFVQVTALVICLIAWWWKDKTPISTLWQIQPKYLLLGGVIGAFITITVVKSMEYMGPAKAVLVIVISQIAIAYIIELFGWFQVEKQPFVWRNFLGLLLAIAGVAIFQWKS